MLKTRFLNYIHFNPLSPFDSIFALVREAAPPAIWSLGVELTRNAAIIVERQTDEEVALRVSTPGKSLSSTVRLWPTDGDWFCDCARSTDACEHVAACVIVLRKGIEKSGTAAVHDRIRYDFVRQGNSLTLNRVWETSSGEVPFKGSWHQFKRTLQTAFSASQLDASVDSLVAEIKVSVLPEDILVRLLHLMKGTANATLDAKPVSIVGPATAYQILIEDSGVADVRVKAQLAPAVKEIFGNAVILSDEGLGPAKEAALGETAKKILTTGRLFKPAEFTGLVSRLVPELEKSFTVTNRSERLTLDQAEDNPRVIVQSFAERDSLTLLPLLVYGDPPYARVDGEGLTLLGDSRRVPKRQPEVEARAAQAFRTKTGLSIAKRAVFRGDSALLMAERFSDHGLLAVGDGLKLFARSPALQPKLTVAPDTFRFEFSIGVGDQSANVRDVITSWQEGRDRVALLDGGWATIPKEWLDKHAHMVLDLLNDSSSKKQLSAFTKVELARLCEEMDSPCPADFSELRKSLDGFEKLPSASLPTGLNATLRPYQKLGVDWLLFLKKLALGGLLADDMGLGKTLQTICALGKPSLVVAPTGLLSNWQNEIGRFRPDLKVAVHHGTRRELDPTADVTLTSYALLRLDLKDLQAVKWDTVVLDEAQNIKNPESQAARAACDLKADFRIALSGTPVENRIDDLWSLFHFINPGLLGDLTTFKQRPEKDLSRKTKPFVLRRLKKEVAPELAPKTEIVLSVDLDDTEKSLYAAIHAASRKDVVEKLNQGGNVMAVLETLLRLRQAACHPGLIPGQSAPDSSKFRVLREKLEEIVAEGHKALIFSQWTSLLDLLAPTLASVGLNFARIDGATSADERAAIVSTFQSESGPPLLMMTLKTGGVGLNLTAADHVFLVDPWWNPATEDQAADRTHRIGQDKPVFIHRLVSVGTVEEKILALQNKKRDIAQKALEGSVSGALTRKDLLELLD